MTKQLKQKLVEWPPLGLTHLTSAHIRILNHFKTAKIRVTESIINPYRVTGIDYMIHCRLLITPDRVNTIDEFSFLGVSKIKPQISKSTWLYQHSLKIKEDYILFSNTITEILHEQNQYLYNPNKMTSSSFSQISRHTD